MILDNIQQKIIALRMMDYILTRQLDVIAGAYSVEDIVDLWESLKNAEVAEDEE